MTGNGVADIYGNKVNACDSTGISMTTSSDDSHIHHNDVGSGGAIGINLNGVANCDVHDNNLYLNATHGIDVTSSPRNAIHHNKVHDNVGNGIRITSVASANSAELNVVQGNVVEGNNSGNSASFAEIMITSNAGVAHRGTVVNGNVIHCTGSNNTGILEVTGTVDFSVIVGNVINLVSGTAIATIGVGTVNSGNTNYT